MRGTRGLSWVWSCLAGTWSTVVLGASIDSSQLAPKSAIRVSEKAEADRPSGARWSGTLVVNLA